MGYLYLFKDIGVISGGGTCGAGLVGKVGIAVSKLTLPNKVGKLL